MGAVPPTLANPEIGTPTGRRKPDAGRIWDAPEPLRLWHLASLDAPTVAVVWTLGIAWAARVRLPVWVFVLLALAAWAVYIGDRLLDAHTGLRTGRTRRLRERHLFHWNHRRILTPLAVAAALAAAGVALVLMPAAARERNSVLAAAAMAYFTGVHAGRGKPLAPFLTKELLVGVLFTAGCALPAVNRAGAAGWTLAVPVTILAALAWLNCTAIERWEREAAGTAVDFLDEGPMLLPPEASLSGTGAPNSNGKARLRPTSVVSIGSVLGVAGLLLACGMAFALPRPAALTAAAAASALLLALLDRTRSRLSPLALRAAADLVLLTPLVLLLR
jgi:hypothetical protein